MDHETAENIKRHFNVVAEGLRTEIRTVAEGVGASNERLERIEVRVESVEARVECVEAGVERIEMRLTAEFDEIKAMIRVVLWRA